MPPQPGVLQELPLRQIALGKTNHRPKWHFDAKNPEMAELIESVRSKGVLQPVLVTPRNGSHLLVAGERRFHAATAAELFSIPALVRQLDDTEVLECQVIENSKRADLDPISEAHGFEQLLKRPDYSMDRLADRVGHPKRYVLQRLELLRLDGKVQDLVVKGDLGLGSALAIARLGKTSAQRSLAIAAVRDGMGARAVASRVRWDARDLTRAAFDKKECSTCRHNGSAQLDLFDTGNELKGRCASPACFDRKVEEHLTVRLQEAEKNSLPVYRDRKELDAGRKTDGAMTLESMEQRAPGYKIPAACKTCKRKGVALVKQNYGSGQKIVVEVCVDKKCRAEKMRKPTDDTPSQSSATSCYDHMKDERIFAGLLPLLARSTALDANGVWRIVITAILRARRNRTENNIAVAHVLAAAGVISCEDLDKKSRHAELCPTKEVLKNLPDDELRLARLAIELAIVVGESYRRVQEGRKLPSDLCAGGLQPGVEFRYTRPWLRDMFVAPTRQKLAKELGLKSSGSGEQLVQRILDAQVEKGALPMPAEFQKVLSAPTKPKKPRKRKAATKKAKASKAGGNVEPIAETA